MTRIDPEERERRKAIGHQKKFILQVTKPVFRRNEPTDRFLLSLARRAYRELLHLAQMEAEVALRNCKTDWAWQKLFRQREAYLRRANRMESSFKHSRGQPTKLFNIEFHLQTPGGEHFEDVLPTSAPDVEERQLWQPTWLPVEKEYVTIGTVPLGGFRVYNGENRFKPCSIFDYEERWSDRLLTGPIEYFLYMRVTGGEEACDASDRAIDNRRIAGKCHQVSQRASTQQKLAAVKKNAKRLRKNEKSKVVDTKLARLAERFDEEEEDALSEISSQTSATGFVTSYDYTIDNQQHVEPEVVSIPASPDSQKSRKAQNKKASYTPYVEYDDPTVPSAEDLEEAKKAEWRERYLRGDTLYWQDAPLSSALGDNLYFDSSSIDASLRTASEFEIDSIDQSTHSSVFFEGLPSADDERRRFSLDDFQPSSSVSVYFDDTSYAYAHTSTHTSGDTWKTCSFGSSATDIFFSEADLPAARAAKSPLDTLRSSSSSIYFECDSSAPITSSLASQDGEESHYSPPNVTFDFADQYTTPLAQALANTTFDQYIAPEQEAKEAPQTSSLFLSPHSTNDQFDAAIYGNPSLRMEFIQ